MVYDTDDKNLVGIYNIGIWVYFEEHPVGTYGSSTKPFKLIVTLLNCDNAVVTSANLENQKYMIGDPGITYKFPPSTISKKDCEVKYSYTVNGIAGRIISFDEANLEFTIASVDDFDLSGSFSTTYIISVTAYSGGALNYAKNPKTFKLELIHPCGKPDYQPSLITVSPLQRNPPPYFYTESGASIQIAPFVVKPAFCPVTYECIRVQGKDESLTCDQFSFPSNEVMFFKSFDMAKFRPGQYELTVRGTIGIQNTLDSEVILAFTLVDPCPDALVSNLNRSPFDDVIYYLGSEQSQQVVQRSQIYQLTTQVDCGPVIVNFYVDGSKDVNI